MPCQFLAAPSRSPARSIKARRLPCEGTVRQIGTPRQVYFSPSEAFVETHVHLSGQSQHAEPKEQQYRKNNG